MTAHVILIAIESLSFDPICCNISNNNGYKLTAMIRTQKSCCMLTLAFLKLINEDCMHPIQMFLGHLTTD